MLYRFYHQFSPTPLVSSEGDTEDMSLVKPVMTASAAPPATQTSTQIEKPTLNYNGATHTGLCRENNEDSFFVSQDGDTFIVCDGMGGHAAGEKASALAVDELAARLYKPLLEQALQQTSHEQVPFLFNQAIVDEAFQAANTRIYQAAKTQPAWQGMGSTAVVAFVQGQQLHIANVGDSRAYLWRKGQLRQLTRDHSVAAQLGLSADEVREHPLRNRLTMALGSERGLQPYYQVLHWKQDDKLLLCSDGLWDMLSDHEIAAVLGSDLSPKQTVQLFIQAANAAGGHDNITAVVCAFS